MTNTSSTRTHLVGAEVQLPGGASVPRSRLRICIACAADIVNLGRDVGWVDITSGDDGGTYDICPERYDETTDTQHGHIAG